MNRILQTLFLITVLATTSGVAQPRMYVNGHLSLQPGQRVEDRYTSPGIIGLQGDTVETTLGIGGGLGLGWMFSRSFGFYMNGDWVFQSDNHNPKETHPANTFDFDLGARIHPFASGAFSPYFQLNYGYSNLTLTVGEPTIYVGPGQSSYSSGIDAYEGHHFAFAAGLELGESQIDDKVLGSWDVHFVIAQSKYADTPTITTYRLNVGYTWWFLF